MDSATDHPVVGEEDEGEDEGEEEGDEEEVED